MSWRRAKTLGWAAVDLKQPFKLGNELEPQNEPYPPISGKTPLRDCQNFAKNDDSLVKSFSSVVLAPAIKFPVLRGSKSLEDVLQVDADSIILKGNGSEGGESNDALQSYQGLKELHCWADKSLIEDVLAAVNNDVDKASDVLKGMVSPGIIEMSNETRSKHLEYKNGDVPDNSDLKFKGSEKRQEQNVALEKHLIPERIKVVYDLLSSGKMVPDLQSTVILDMLRSIPEEPEWEEDDIYLLHRKDAIRMMRLASRHAKLADDAYRRGDHYTAQEFSSKAQEEWNITETLHYKAAKEIFTIKNCKNDEWKLDLHGLHASEAVQFLLEHLQKIECRLQLKRFSYPNKDNREAPNAHPTPLESANRMEVVKWDDQQQSSRQRAPFLEVITGSGNHSRGQAALLTAVKSFLAEKRYHYYEPRSGVFFVQPKFRRQ